MSASNMLAVRRIPGAIVPESFPRSARTRQSAEKLVRPEGSVQEVLGFEKTETWVTCYDIPQDIRTRHSEAFRKVYSETFG
jgi:hypothetical protein